MSRGFPSMTALLGLIAVAGYQNRDKIAEILGGLGKSDSNDPAGRPARQGQSQAGGGSLGNLGGLLAGTSVGGLLNGGIGELMERFNQTGQKDKAESWVRTGPNQDIAPEELKQAVGSDVLAELSQATGLSEQELLARLTRELPTAVDRYTPAGRLESA